MGILALDDRDASIIYSPGWAQAGSKSEYNGTTSWTAVAGSTAKVTFVGSSIGVYGTIPAKLTPASVAPVSAYSIDGGTATLFRATEAARTQFSQLFFQSPVLADGTHTLTISHPTVSDPFFLDYLMVLQSTPATPTLPIGSTTSTSATSTSTTSSTSSLTTTTSVSSTTSASSTTTSSTVPVNITVTVTSPAQSTTAALDADSASANTSNTNGAASSSHTGAIVGGIIGAIIVLFLLGFGFILWRRKRRDRRTSMIASNFWNTDPSGLSQTPTKPFAAAAAPTLPRMSNSAPVMAQTTGSSGGYNARYQGSYAPPAPPAQVSPYGGYAPYSFPAHNERVYYNQGYPDPGQGYAGGGAYLPPSQIINANLNAGSDYGRGR